MEGLGKKGYNQGDMSCVSKEQGYSEGMFSQRGFSKTTEYMARQDAQQKMAAKDLNKQPYKGRYS